MIYLVQEFIMDEWSATIKACKNLFDASCTIEQIMEDEKFETYDDGGTSDIFYEEEYMIYADLILEGCKKHGFDTVVFCYSSPLMSEPFIRRLSYTGLKIYYVTKIAMINKK